MHNIYVYIYIYNSINDIVICSIRTLERKKTKLNKEVFINIYDIILNKDTIIQRIFLSIGDLIASLQNIQ